MVKNNILLSVLLASFAAPVLASGINSISCPVGENGKAVAKFVGTFIALDEITSRYTSLPRAFTFHKGDNESLLNQRNSEYLKNQANALTFTQDAAGNDIIDVAAVAKVKESLLNASNIPSKVEKTWLQKAMETNVSVNVGSAFAKAVGTVVLLKVLEKGLEKGVALVTKK